MHTVIPAQAGIQEKICEALLRNWIPAYAGMTNNFPLLTLVDLK
jgi:hypothetical protein